MLTTEAKGHGNSLANSSLKRVLCFLLCLCVSVVPVCFLAGCRPAALVVPSYIQSVGVELFQNRTSAFGLETLFTQATIRQFQIDGRLALEDPGRADLAVRAVIRKYIEEPLFYDTKTNNVLQYRLSIVYDLASLDQREKRTFFEENERVYSVFYNTPQYAGAVSETKEQAFARLAEELSRSIVRRVLEGH